MLQIVSHPQHANIFCCLMEKSITQILTILLNSRNQIVAKLLAA